MFDCRWWPGVAAGLLLAGCGHAPPPPPPKAVVTVVHPLVRDIVDWDEYVGRFEAIQNAEVRPQVDGTVTRVLFRGGQDVRRGQPLFEIDPRPYRAAYAQSQAQAQRAAATLANAETELARADKLHSLSAVSQEELEQKQANRRTAAADLAAARAAQATARLNLGFTQVRAPVAGRVSDKRVSIGDAVSNRSTLLTTVVTLDPIWFSFEGAESLYLKYTREAAKGQRGSSRTTPNPVDVQLADESTYGHHGRMVFVDNAIDPRSGTIRAHAEFANRDHLLTPGMFGRARLLGSGTYRGVLVPDEAVVTDQARQLVYTVGAGGTVAAHEVVTGPIVEGLRVVRSGVAAGDWVVLDGLTRLQPGTAVTAKRSVLHPRAPDTVSHPLTAPPPASATVR